MRWAWICLIPLIACDEDVDGATDADAAAQIAADAGAPIADGSPHPDAGASGADAAAGTSFGPLLTGTLALPDELFMELELTAQDAVYFADQASTAAGGSSWVLTGTLVEGTTGWTHDAAPADKLVVELVTGLVLELRFDAFVPGGSDFFADDHEIAFRLTVPATAEDVHIRDVRSGANVERAAAGVLAMQGVTYELDVVRSGTEQNESDSTGGTSKRDLRTTGTIFGADARHAVDVAVTSDLIWVTGPFSSVGSSAVTVNSRIEAGGDVFQWVNAFTSNGFKDGKPDYDWRATGEVRRNGAAWGQYRYAQTAGVHSFVVDLPGETVTLASWH